MSKPAKNNQLIIPDFSENDIRALKKYFEFSSRYREQMNLEFEEKLKDHPLWGPMLKQMPAEQRKAQNERSHAMQKAAIYEGKWEDYAKDLLAQGRVYAQMNIDYDEWYELIRMAKTMLMPYVKKDFAHSIENALDVIDGLSKLVDYAMYGIAVAYFVEKNELIRMGEERFRLIFNASDDTILMVSKTGEIITINHSTQMPQEELIGKKIYDFQGAENSLKTKEALENVISSKKPVVFEVDALSNGKTHYYSSKISPVFDDKEEVSTLVVISRDITNEKEAEMELVKLNATLEQKVAERTEELAIINSELESFTYSVSHDLRAPLRAISGFSEILKTECEEQLSSDGKEFLEDIILNARKMGLLIDSLLEFSRLGKQSIVKSLVDMNELFDTTCEDLQRFSAKKVNITIAPLKSASGDRSMLKQVIFNLVSNAIKYSSKKENPHIEIGASEERDQIVYFVKDNGAGFNMAYYDKLFKVFQRLHGATDFDGTGVGLAIVQRIVSKHNGKVWAEGKENEGATFYFSLPVN